MKTYQSILVPTDGSEGVGEALDHALTLARQHEAIVHALYVVDQRLSLAADNADREDLVATLHQRGEAAVDAVEAAAADADVEVMEIIREGVPDKVIVEYARQQDIDVIVMGTHGRTGRDRIANLGSVTDRVVTKADRPVFVVHVGDGE